jgi:RNA polymerase-binding protein DksA
MGLGLLAAIFAFVMGMMMMRRMRRSLIEEASLDQGPSTPERFPLHTYHAVIQQLKQQKHELLSEQQIERRRAKASENISAAVLSNLSCGVVFFTQNGLIRQANAAAKHILGFASLAGMNAAEVFGAATLLSASGSYANIAQAIEASLREKTPPHQLALRYMTPASVERTLEITVTSVHSPAGDVLGAACLINDQTEVAQIRRQQTLRGEMSAEMALELRNRDRERKLIKKIEETIAKIDMGEYGYCESCGVEIGLKRLEARPTATLCIDCKTLDELRERLVDARAALEERREQLEQRQQAIEVRAQQIEARAQELDSRADEVQAQRNELDEQVAVLASRPVASPNDSRPLSSLQATEEPVEAITGQEAEAVSVGEAPPAVAQEPSGVYVQLGAFNLRQNAESFLAHMRIEMSWLAGAIGMYARDGLYRVHAGPYADRVQADEVARRIEQSMDLKPILITR